MPLSIPPELKKITPYVRRAEELDRDKANPESRLVAYYCRQHAVHSGIEFATSAEGKSCLGSLLNVLEGEKEAMNAFTRDEAKFLCRKFADKVFDKADEEDRSGKATRDTAKTFYAAASFLEMLQQFYKDDDDSEEMEEIKKRSVYSKWKATDILKAIKEGREPTPGGYGENQMEDDESENKVQEHSPKVETVTDKDDERDGEEMVTTTDEDDEPGRIFVPTLSEEQEEEEEELGTEVELGPPPPAYPGPTAPTAPSAETPAPAPAVTFTPMPPPQPQPPADLNSMPPPPPTNVKMMPSPTPPEKKKGGGFFGLGKKKSKISKAEIADATELTRFALAALEDKNADLAAERLQKALKVLGR